MTANSSFFRSIPLLLFAGMAILSICLHFNGLYGQDAHAYLRDSKAFFDFWHAGTTIPEHPGKADFASGYPLAGALLRYLLIDPILALQVISWLAFALSAWLLERILVLLAHGSRADSRWVFVGLGLVLAPVFIRSGITVMSDALGLMLTLATFFFALRWIEHERNADMLWATIIMTLSVSVRIGLAALLIPLVLVLTWHLVQRRKWGLMTAAILLGVALLLPHVWLTSDVLSQPFQHSMLKHWSSANFFHRSFQNENGFSQYLLPNILYLAFPLMHPGFCLLLPGLLLLAKKTDIVLRSKKVILICVVAYLCLLGGLPHQNLRFLLPAYVLLLLLLFPAWDRMYCYGFYFFKRLTWSILGLTFLLQFIANIWMLRPFISRNHFEKEVSAALKPTLPVGATVYGFDLDIALSSYLPGVRWMNLWERRYEDFPAGSFVLFNEPKLRTQWEGQNPMLNWDFLREKYRLETVQDLPEGWLLYRVKGRR